MRESPPPVVLIGSRCDNRGMAENYSDTQEAAADIRIVIEDEGELTQKELAQERKAQQEAQQRLTWMRHTPQQLAERIPVSIFAMGDLARAG